MRTSLLSRRARRALPVLILAGLLALAAEPAFASGGGAMPWDDKLTAIADSITGPVARAIGILSIAGACFGVALSESGSWTRRGLSIVFALAIAFTATSFGLPFLGYTSGAAF